MFLNSPDKTLEASFRVAHGESSFMVYASTDSCFECGDIGRKRFACPHKNHTAAQENWVSTAAERRETAEVDVTQDPGEGTSPAREVNRGEEVSERSVYLISLLLCLSLSLSV